jgi:hypothetical protein
LIKNWTKLVLWPAIGVIVFGLAQKLFLPYDFLRHFGYEDATIPAYQTVDSNLEYRRIQSTLRGANPLGAYLSLIITSAVIVWRRNWFKFVFIAAALVALIFSYSRSAWLATLLVVSLVVYWSLNNKKRQRLSVAVLAATALSLAGLYFLRNEQVAQTTIFHTSSESVNESSNQARSEALRAGWNDLLNEPLGRGPGTAGPASFRNDDQPRIAENYFLQIGQEVGWLGLATFIAINALVAYKLSFRNDNLAKVLFASFFGITLVNLMLHAWTDDTLSLMWWGLAGVALAPAILKPKRKSNG